MSEPMEAILDAGNRLEASGFAAELVAAPLGRLHCGDCGATVDAEHCAVTGTLRFEGESNPGDEAILIALVTPCGHHGLFSCAYGLAASIDDIDVLLALPPSAEDLESPTDG